MNQAFSVSCLNCNTPFSLLDHRVALEAEAFEKFATCPACGKDVEVSDELIDTAQSVRGEASGSGPAVAFD